MQQIQGFISKSNFVSNENRTVAEFFELSPLALSYSRDRGEYQHSNHSGTTLHTFQSVDILSDEQVTLTSDQVTKAISVVNSMLAYMNSHAFPYDTSDFKDTIRAAYSGVITDFNVSDLFAGQVTTFPEWATWTTVTDPSTSYKLWFRNESFETQYTETEILSVPVIDNLDDFFGNYGSMVTRLNALSLTTIMDRLQEARSGFPETYARINAFSYINPNNPTQSVKVNWGSVIYGANGDNIDSIKESLENHILSNSTHTREDWEVIFPEIFHRTEFLFLPRWDTIAIPNLTTLSGLYSSIQGLSDSLTYAEAWLNRIPYDWILTTASIIPFDYKAISLICIPGTTNAVGYENIKEAYGDYIPVGTSSVDFSRMSFATRGWVSVMVELIRAAETATETSSLTAPMRKVHRNGLLYIARAIGDVNFMVAARSNTKPVQEVPA